MCTHIHTHIHTRHIHTRHNTHVHFCAAMSSFLECARGDDIRLHQYRHEFNACFIRYFGMWYEMIALLVYVCVCVCVCMCDAILPGAVVLHHYCSQGL